jgi:hypothetical protein
MTEKLQAVPSRPTKLPPRTVICSDFEVVIDGRRYWPHAGEKLVISGQGSIDDVVLSMGLASLRNAQNLTPEEAKEAKETLELMLARSEAAIESWTWTDNRGNEYPAPTAEVLRRLSPEEIGYINEKVISGGDSKDAAKNGSSPSTSHSMRRRAPARRRNG